MHNPHFGGWKKCSKGGGYGNGRLQVVMKAELVCSSTGHASEDYYF